MTHLDAILNFSHRNIAKFFGIFQNHPNSGNNSFRVWEYFNKGSLYDLLYVNTSLNLTTETKVSILDFFITENFEIFEILPIF